jgi:hypothetical protein
MTNPTGLVMETTKEGRERLFTRIMQTQWRQEAEAILRDFAKLEEEVARLQSILDVRDDFIVSRDLWSDFVATLPLKGMPAAPRDDEAGKIEAWLRKTAHDFKWGDEKRSPRHFMEQIADSIASRKYREG